jgi:hypothetical protein
VLEESLGIDITTTNGNNKTWKEKLWYHDIPQIAWDRKFRINFQNIDELI